MNENRCNIKEAALDLTLYFLREMKQDEAADTLEGLIKSCANSTKACEEKTSRDVNEPQFGEVILLKHFNGSSSCQTVCSFSLLQSIADEGSSEEKENTRCLNDHSIEDIHLDQTMKIIQLHIYLLMCSQATESLTNITVTLGADVNISCDLDIEEIYWYKQKSPDPPMFVLRTYDSTYQSSKLTHKYSVKTNSSLFIRNITIDEIGVYYCVKTSEPQKFSNGTKIYITDSVQKNQTSVSESHDTPHQKLWINLTIIIITSVLITASVTIAVIGLIKSCTNSSRGCKESINVNELQFAEAVLLKHLNGSSCQTVCSFSLLKSITDEGGSEEKDLL
ncbi:hypothetical protein Q8A67_006156 [Cirrhinus molitorella]|uniref:Ig-like domain-containing protein n=1 Tax=Cirrhinus molitorella TaxID=172907 RepID=A0AA88Q026_9TELE|nr:hypothetical protein Q8A67_006156 [Cirrhinus molitorella]